MIAVVLAALVVAAPTPSPTLPLPTPVVNYYAAQGARASGLDAALVRAIIDNESAGDPHAVSRAGAVGLMQLEPAASSDCGGIERLDAGQNAACGSRLLASLIRSYGSLRLGIAAYNWGAGNVRAHPDEAAWPKETRNYVASVVARYDALQHVALVISTPAPVATPAPTQADPCAGKHRLFCGRIRIVPADTIERGLWYGRLISEVYDGVQSARAMRLLSERSSLAGSYVTPSGMRYAVAAPSPTTAELLGAASPSAMEATSYFRGLSQHGFIGYMLGFALYDVAQSAASASLPRFGFRPLDVVSRRWIYLHDVAAHIAGGMSWDPYFRATPAGREKYLAKCRAHVQAALEKSPQFVLVANTDGGPGRGSCAPVWPTAVLP